MNSTFNAVFLRDNVITPTLTALENFKNNSAAYEKNFRLSDKNMPLSS
jgi:hypothetical protein